MASGTIRQPLPLKIVKKNYTIAAGDTAQFLRSFAEQGRLGVYFIYASGNNIEHYGIYGNYFANCWGQSGFENPMFKWNYQNNADPITLTPVQSIPSGYDAGYSYLNIKNVSEQTISVILYLITLR